MLFCVKKNSVLPSHNTLRRLVRLQPLHSTAPRSGCRPVISEFLPQKQPYLPLDWEDGKSFFIQGLQPAPCAVLISPDRHQWCSNCSSRIPLRSILPLPCTPIEILGGQASPTRFSFWPACLSEESVHCSLFAIQQPGPLRSVHTPNSIPQQWACLLKGIIYRPG